MTDTTELFDRPPTAPRRRRGDNRPPSSDLFVLAAGVLISVIVVIVIVLALLGDDESSVDTTDTSTTDTTTESTTTESTTETTASTSTDPATSASTSTTEATTTSSATTASTAQTTTVVDPETYQTAVWPWVDSTSRFSDPVDAARNFAEEFVGFTDPVVGAFQQGDSRSGEVEVRPATDGPITVVFVRRLGPDDTWWVLGAAATDITIDDPSAVDVVESPMTVAGTVLAFEGHVDITLRADGVAQPLAETFATGGGDQARPFETTVEWTPTDAERGALVLTTSGGEDGRIWEASVLRLLFEDA